MTLLILGLVLWWAAHLFKRVAPGARAGLGKKGMGLVAVAVLASVVLMVLGYRAADGAVYWGRSGALTGVNNLLMVLSFYIYSSGAAPPGKPRNWIGVRTRHPQLIGFALWCVAHLVVNGDVPSFVLFGGLLLWALVAMAVINARAPAWEPPAYGGPRSEVRVAVISLVMLVVVMLIHHWLGVTPWG